MERFSEKTVEAIKYYIYALLDPRDNKIFYIGKGKGNRVFAHLNGALDNPESSDKLNLIREIISTGDSVKHYIIRHGIEDERKAFEIESTIIDLLTYDDYKHLSNITNKVAGHHTWDRGIKRVNEIEQLYAGEQIDERKVYHNLLLININFSYRPDISLYEATRKNWKLSMTKARNVDYVCSEYRGIIRAVFKPHTWHNTVGEKRIYFEGEEVFDKDITDLYLNKAYALKKKGAANPVRYLRKSTNN
jgi:uncharacterized protein